MSTNLYWPVYKNLEKQICNLCDLVHFDDRQIGIYSVRISELLIRCSVEIESISKELFIQEGGEIPEDRDLYFDTDCIEYLDRKWKLSKKIVLLTYPSFHFTQEENRVLTPLHKANKRGSSGSDWKKAYQAVKHDRAKNLTRGNIKNLIRALGGLFILNLYYLNESYDLEKDVTAKTFPINCGSEVFSIKLHKWSSYSASGEYKRKTDFDDCIYLTKWKQGSIDAVNSAEEERKNKLLHSLLKDPAMVEWLKNNDITNYSGKNIAIDALGSKKYSQMVSQSFIGSSKPYNSLSYEAILNKNDI